MKGIQLGLIAIVAITVFGVAGCKKDKTPAPPVTNKTYSLKYFPLEVKGLNTSIIYRYDRQSDLLYGVSKLNNHIDTTHYSADYNDLGQPRSITIYGSDYASDWLQTQYTLNAQGQVIRGDVYTFKLDSNGSGEKFYRPDTIKSYYTLTYNTLSQLTQVSYFHANGQKDHDKFDKFFDYTSDGNISKVNSPAVMNLEYDQLNGFAKDFKYGHLFYIEGVDELLFHSKNNPAKVNGVSRTYKYNNDQYPVEMTIDNPAGSQVFNITYYITKKF